MSVTNKFHSGKLCSAPQQNFSRTPMKIRNDNNIQGVRIRDKIVKLTVFADDMHDLLH